MNFPLIATECYAYNSLASVESIKPMTIIEAKMRQNGGRSQRATLKKFFAFLGLESNYDLYRLHGIKGSFD